MQFRKCVLIFFSSDFFPGKKVGASSSRELSGRSVPLHLLARLPREGEAQVFACGCCTRSPSCSWRRRAPRPISSQGTLSSTLKKKTSLAPKRISEHSRSPPRNDGGAEGARLSREKSRIDFRQRLTRHRQTEHHNPRLVRTSVCSQHKGCERHWGTRNHTGWEQRLPQEFFARLGWRNRVLFRISRMRDFSYFRI